MTVRYADCLERILNRTEGDNGVGIHRMVAMESVRHMTECIYSENKSFTRTIYNKRRHHKSFDFLPH